MMRLASAKPAISRLSDIVGTEKLTLKLASKHYSSFSAFGYNETIATSADPGGLTVSYDVSIGCPTRNRRLTP